MAQDTEIVIIGGGPVGTTLANLLGMQGVTAVVLEREAAIYDLPRAVHFDDEIMRVLQTIGLAETMVPLVHVSPGMKFVDADGRLLLDWPRPQQIGPQGWHVSYRFHQPELEQVLRAGLARFPSVSLRLATEVFALEPDTDGVTIRYQTLRTGQQETLRARYVVGCDGARSMVRRIIGAPMEDMNFHERWLVVDALLRRLRPDLGDYSVQYCDPERPATYVRGTGDRRRWELSVKPDEDTAAVAQPANVMRLLERFVAGDDVTLERAVVYTFHAAIAEQWRSNRLLIAGDAAHLTPPFLGQGLCAGIRDVANLAWKLSRVLRGLNPDSLLDSYQSERGPHVREYIELAIRLGGLINTKAIPNAVSDAVQNRQQVARMTSIKPRLGPGLGKAEAPRGQITPQPILSDGMRLDDRLGYRPVLLLRSGSDEPDGLTRRDIGTVVDPVCDRWLDELGGVAVLVRPDRYILGVARDTTEIRDLIACL